MLWAVYVSDKPHSQINFPIGMNNGIWGVKEEKKRTIQKVKVGDLVAFIYSISWLKAEGPPPSGFSRVGKDKLHEFRGGIQKLVIGEVTEPYYEDHEEVWPDDVYPHRFRFKVLTQEKNILFGTEFYSPDFVEAVRYSACTQGSITAAESIVDIRDIEHKKVEYSPIGPVVGDGIAEGRPIYKIHRVRERDPKLVKQKKDHVLNSKGCLECEVCGFDFQRTYGEIGYGFVECHHIDPLKFRGEGTLTTIEDLALLCSNCHRMIHNRHKWLKIEELKALYDKAN